MVRSNYNDHLPMDVGEGANAISSGTLSSASYIESPELTKDLINNATDTDVDISLHIVLPKHNVLDAIYKICEVVVSSQHVIEDPEHISCQQDQCDQDETAQERSPELSYIELVLLDAPNQNDQQGGLTVDNHMNDSMHNGALTDKSAYPDLDIAANIVIKDDGPNSGLITGQSTHTGKKRPVCDECNQSFYDRSGLVRHKRGHRGSKPYECGICNSSFAQKTNLERHEKRHKGEKEHLCGSCGQGFVTKYELEVHRTTRRRKTGKMCVTKYELDMHRQTRRRKTGKMCVIP